MHPNEVEIRKRITDAQERLMRRSNIIFLWSMGRVTDEEFFAEMDRLDKQT